MFKLHYHITNNGDGSASVVLHKSALEAEQADENMDEGWGEPCNGYAILRINPETNQIEYQNSKYHWEGEGKNKKYVREEIWVPLEKS